MNGPITLIGAVALNVLIGLLCLAAGLLLVGAFLDGMLDRIGISPRDAFATRAIVFGMPIYGACALIGAIATWRRSARGWWLVLTVDIVGIAFLAWAVSIDAPGFVYAALLLWSLAVALLVVPATRAALRR